ncbi:MAG: hypothetical protein DWP92_08230 [Armatimonadetes bacterium]|nr:MAG: hypothetical protein DWP92_08230 [Armatimonadota bacterium]
MGFIDSAIFVNRRQSLFCPSFVRHRIAPERVELVSEVFGVGRKQVAVDVHRHGNRRVSQVAFDRFGVRALADEEGNSGVPQVVHS